MPFKCLEEVTLSGDLHYKGKLSWTRKTCALSEGRLLCYKPDKCDSKSALVIQLTGYNSTYVEKDSRKGFEIRLIHPTLEVHIFSVDFKEWAVLWCDVSIFCCRLLFKNRNAFVGVIIGGAYVLSFKNVYFNSNFSFIYNEWPLQGENVSNSFYCILFFLMMTI